MNLSTRRIGAIARKELREYRHDGIIVATMAIVPLIFLIQPLVLVLTLPDSAAVSLSHRHLLLYMLGIPALAPAMLAAYSVVGERQQGTLEPVLTTPMRREEFLLGKALAAFLPSVAVSYAVYGAFLACVGLFARPAVAAGLLRAPDIIAQFLCTPPLTAWPIWAGATISSRCHDIRVAQQLSFLVSLPPLALTSMLGFSVIQLTPGLVLALTALLLLAAGLGWRVTAAAFSRERLIAH